MCFFTYSKQVLMTLNGCAVLSFIWGEDGLVNKQTKKLTLAGHSVKANSTVLSVLKATNSQTKSEHAGCFILRGLCLPNLQTQASLTFVFSARVYGKRAVSGEKVKGIKSIRKANAISHPTPSPGSTTHSLCEFARSISWSNVCGPIWRPL